MSRSSAVRRWPTSDQFDQPGVGFFSTALLVFAFISLFVGGFTIFNTFSIIVGQRTRELALLRILGASRRQIFRSVLAEAGIVGLLASIVGLALGVLAAAGLEALLNVSGSPSPPGARVRAPDDHRGSHRRIGVTVVSAISPARRAVRIAPWPLCPNTMSAAPNRRGAASWPVARSPSSA